jgi:hypothetical protein
LGRVEIMKSTNELIDEILDEIKEEEKEKELRNQEIIKNGCPHSNKTKRIATISRIHFLECDVCRKHFDLQGVEILT